MRDKWLTKPVAGWLMYDFANSAFATTVLAVIFNRYFAEVIAGGTTGTQWSLGDWSIRVPGAAMWNFVVAASMALVAVSSPIFGAIADRHGIRKKMLGIYCYLGVICTAMLTFVGTGDILLAALLFIGANLGFSGGNVFYNAFLLDLGNEKTYGRISGVAWGFGYLGGGLCLVLNLIMLQKPQLLGFPSGYFTVGDCILVSAIWWGLFALPTFFWIREKTVSSNRTNMLTTFAYGWRQVGQTIRQIRKFKQLLRFLIAYLIFNDGIETVIVTASIFGAEVVGMNTGELILFFILIQGMGMVGSMIFGWLADKMGNKNSLLLSLGIWLAIVIWAFNLGWMIDMKREFYVLGILSGLVMGGSQSTARSLQALFTPAQHSAEYFGLFSLSGRFANIFGTAIYGAVIVITGGVQTAILALGVFFLAGGIILLFVDEQDGAETAKKATNAGIY